MSNEPTIAANSPASADIIAEGAISLSAAARAVPNIDGHQPSPSTVWRWCRVGIRGIRLDYVRLGRRVVTSEAALARFSAALAKADRPAGVRRNGGAAAASPRTEGDRSKAIREAEERLAEAGI